MSEFPIVSTVSVVFSVVVVVDVVVVVNLSPHLLPVTLLMQQLLQCSER